VAWPGCERAALEREGVHARIVADVIGPAGAAAAAAAERGFARVWARVPLADGHSFRDLVTWRGESLLWVAESYLLRATAGPRCAGLAETCLRLLEATDPAEVDASGLAPHETLLLARAATLRGVLFHGEADRASKPLAPAPPSIDEGRRGILGRRPWRGSAAPRPAAGASLLAVHDGGAPALLDLLGRARARAGLQATVVSLDAMAGSESARARAAAGEAERTLRATLERLRGTAGLLASYSHRGVGFAEVAALDLEAVLLGHLPRAVRVAERAADLLEAGCPPSLVVVAVGDRDVRRAVGLAAKAASVPWAAFCGAGGTSEERVDGGPLPVARLGPGAEGGEDDALARLLDAARGSLGAR
jgi:hypothetical protein